MTQPSQQQIAFARRIMMNRTDHEVKRKMEKLEKVRKGAGWPMYEALKIVLAERKRAVTI